MSVVNEMGFAISAELSTMFQYFGTHFHGIEEKKNDSLRAIKRIKTLLISGRQETEIVVEFAGSFFLIAQNAIDGLMNFWDLPRFLEELQKDIMETFPNLFFLIAIQDHIINRLRIAIQEKAVEYNLNIKQRSRDTFLRDTRVKAQSKMLSAQSCNKKIEDLVKLYLKQTLQDIMENELVNP